MLKWFPVFGRLPQPCQPSLAERAGTACGQTAFYGNGSGGFHHHRRNGRLCFGFVRRRSHLAGHFHSYPTSPALWPWPKAAPVELHSDKAGFNSDGTTLTSVIRPPSLTFTATSTTATSTFSTGGLAVGTNQFVVQQNSGNVGIGIAAPDGYLHLSSSNGINFTSWRPGYFGTLQIKAALPCSGIMSK